VNALFAGSDEEVIIGRRSPLSSRLARSRVSTRLPWWNTHQARRWLSSQYRRRTHAMDQRAV